MNNVDIGGRIAAFICSGVFVAAVVSALWGDWTALAWIGGGVLLLILFLLYFVNRVAHNDHPFARRRDYQSRPSIETSPARPYRAPDFSEEDEEDDYAPPPPSIPRPDRSYPSHEYSDDEIKEILREAGLSNGHKPN